jgi:hypothetical protein
MQGEISSQNKTLVKLRFRFLMTSMNENIVIESNSKTGRPGKSGFAKCCFFTLTQQVLIFICKIMRCDYFLVLYTKTSSEIFLTKSKS